jgi:hypothetical protein
MVDGVTNARFGIACMQVNWARHVWSGDLLWRVCYDCDMECTTHSHETKFYTDGWRKRQQSRPSGLTERRQTRRVSPKSTSTGKAVREA